MLDLGAERGILYAAGGFTEGAVRRAERALNPRVGLEHLAVPIPDSALHEVPLGGVDPRFDRRPPTVHEYARLESRRYEDSLDRLGRVESTTLRREEPYEPSAPTTTSYRTFLLGQAFLYKP